MTWKFWFDIVSGIIYIALGIAWIWIGFKFDQHRWVRTNGVEVSTVVRSTRV